MENCWLGFIESSVWLVVKVIKQVIKMYCISFNGNYFSQQIATCKQSFGLIIVFNPELKTGIKNTAYRNSERRLIRITIIVTSRISFNEKCLLYTERFMKTVFVAEILHKMSCIGCHIKSSLRVLHVFFIKGIERIFHLEIFFCTALKLCC